MSRDRASRVAKKLRGRYGVSADPSTLPEPHSTLLLIERVHELLDDGGFPNLFLEAGPEDFDLEQAAVAHDRIGAEDAAKALRWAAATFGGGKFPSTGQARHDRYCERFSPADFCDEKPCPDWLYFNATAETRRLLAAYVDAHAADFQDL